MATTADLRAQLDAAVYVGGTTPHFELQIDIITGLYCLSLLVVLISLLVRFRRGTLWLLKIQETRYGKLVQANGIAGYLLFSAIFLVQAIPAVRLQLAYTQHADLRYNLLWKTLPWLSLYIAAWCVAAGTAMSSYTLPPSTAIESDHKKRIGLGISPFFINLFFIGLPIIFTALVGLYSARTQILFNAYWDNYRNILNYLKNVDNNTAELDLVLVLVGVTRLKAEGMLAVNEWRKVWIVLTAFGLIEITVFIAASSLYFVSLRASMIDTRLEPSRSRESLTAAFISLIFTTMSTLTMEILFSIVCWFLVFRSSDFATSPKFYDFGVLGPFWIFASLGTLTNLVVLYRSFSNPSKASRNSNHTSMAFRRSRVPVPYHHRGSETMSLEAKSELSYGGKELGSPPTSPRSQIQRMDRHLQQKEVSMSQELWSGGQASRFDLEMKGDAASVRTGRTGRTDCTDEFHVVQGVAV